MPTLDIDIWSWGEGRPPMPISSGYEKLMIDPGEYVGWAALVREPVYHNSRRVAWWDHIECGQGMWWEMLRDRGNFHRVGQVMMESTPVAAIRTMDAWPIRVEGAVRIELFPKEPRMVMPTDLRVARKWFKLPRGHGLGKHANEALAQLLGVLVKDGAKKTKR